VKYGDRVVLLLPRTSAVICCIYGVSKAGAAYIPCDPEYPADRISLITEDSDAAYVITTEEHMAEHGAKAINVRDLLDYPGEFNNPNIDISPDDLVYLIYTSGSTGRPKGVMLRHEAICSYLYDHPANIHIHSLHTENVKAFLSITTLSFDMSLKEYAAALHNGVTLVLANEDEVNNPMLLAGLFARTGAEAINGTPSRLLSYMDAPEFCESLSKCKLVWSGGEKYSDKLLARLHAMNVRIFNTYGPTEITVSSNGCELTHQERVTVGRPLLNCTEFIVDSDGNELPVGVVGELYIGGMGVAKGYNNLPEQTAERFVTYHPANFKAERVYKSGDYARWMPNGQVDILGRTDNQVKLRGLRIELGEVEAAISKVEAVKQAVVMIRTINGKEHLSAYFTAEKEMNIDAMKSIIGETLTPYMVPTAWLQMEAFPLTPNGKTDLKHLPEPVISMLETEYVAPKNKRESDFCAIFEKILDMEKVSAADSFFDLGGTSLTVTRVIIEANNAGYTLAYADVFKNPTAQKLARLLAGDEEDDTSDPEVSDYDYSRINELLAGNNLENFKKGTPLKLGNVLLTGANGYLGIHVLHELLEERNPNRHVYCMVRHGREGMSSEARLKNLLFYYFEDNYSDQFGERIHVIDGDVTNPSAFDAVGDVDTVINCAAVVKHFSEGTEIEDINIGGLQNCVDFCLKRGAQMIQTSTFSVSGQSVNGVPDPHTNYSEQMLYFGQLLSSKYTHSKFLAERILLEAVAEKGLVGKIMRLGNLAPRAADGEFQINFSSNSAMGRLHIYQMLGVCGYSQAMSRMEFSPIDEVAHAILLLARTPRKCVLFHPFNNHMQLLGDVVREMASTLGCSIREVEEEEFQTALQKAGEDPEKARILQSMLAYKASGKNTILGFEKFNPYTCNVLARLGFHWHTTSWDYVSRFVKAIESLDFFEDIRW
jgi:amino acid adenylation domain-containing protein